MTFGLAEGREATARKSAFCRATHTRLQPVVVDSSTPLSFGIRPMPSLDRDAVLSIYNDFPFERHPLWQSIFNHELTLDQILRAETQHFIRSNIGRAFRKRAAEEAANISATAHKLLYETYKEECTDDETGPSHVELIARLLEVGGLTRGQLNSATPTPANAAAIALYKDITDRGPLHHMIGAGAVEYYYSVLSPKVYESYTVTYGMSEFQAETYKIHGPMDRNHAERALTVLEEPVAQQKADSVLLAVRDAFVATCLHYDGMFQAATGTRGYWDYR